MNAIKEVLQFLDRHSDFVADMEHLVQSPQWPQGWLTSHQIAQEVDRFQFWAGVRSRVPEATRAALVEYYLKDSADNDATGWVRIDDQFMFNPDAADMDNGKAVDSKRDQRRRHGRVSCEMLTCQLGEIVNLSASGVMVRCKGESDNQMDDRLGLDLKCLDYDLHVTARVAWVKQNERTFSMGMEFVDLNPDQAERIRELLPIAAAVQAIGGGTGSGSVTHWGK